MLTLVLLFGVTVRSAPPDAFASVSELQLWFTRATVVWKCSASITTSPPLSTKALLLQLPLSGCVQAPALQTSVVQELPSSVQAPVLFWKAQPLAGLQLSVVHSLPSLQVIGAAWQPVAGLQLSVVQAFPSLQVMAVFWQPSAALQLSDVQALPSSQLSGVPAWQPVAEHVSMPLHTTPSSQRPLFGVDTQASVASLQLSDGARDTVVASDRSPAAAGPVRALLCAVAERAVVALRVRRAGLGEGAHLDVVDQEAVVGVCHAVERREAEAQLKRRRAQPPRPAR